MKSQPTDPAARAAATAGRANSILHCKHLTLDLAMKRKQSIPYVPEGRRTPEYLRAAATVLAAQSLCPDPALRACPIVANGRIDDIPAAIDALNRAADCVDELLDALRTHTAEYTAVPRYRFDVAVLDLRRCGAIRRRGYANGVAEFRLAREAFDALAFELEFSLGDSRAGGRF